MPRRIRALIAVLLPLLLVTALAEARTPTPSMPLRLQVGTFDPLAERPPAPSLAGQPEAAPDSPYQIVQFVGPVESAWTAQAEALGATLLGYLPENAYVARVAPADLPKLRSLPSVRWVGPYEPAFKLAPVLTRATASAAADSRVVVTLASFPGETPQTIEALLAGLGATVEELADTSLGVIARADLPAAALGALSGAPAVSWIEPYVEPRTADAQARKILNVESVWASNTLFGAGQIIAVSDSGLDVQGAGGQPGNADFAGRLVRAYAPSEMRPDSPACAAKRNWTDLNGHGTHVAGSVLGSGANSGSNAAAGQFTASEAGVAPRARLVFMAMNTDGSPGIQCVPSNGNYIAFGYQNGARISSNSWGGNTNGAYTVNDSVIDDYIWRNRDYLVLFAAGNSGPNPNTVGSPGSAKNIVSVGASENNRPNLGGTDPVNGGSISDNPNTMAYFSSRGPTDDGRIKPDIVAPGTNIISVLGAEAGGLRPIAPGQPYAASSGTSMATPLTAGTAALVREWLVTQRGIANPSAALVKALLIHGAFQLPGAATPNPNSGWGRVDLRGTIGASYSLFEDSQAGLRLGETRIYTVTVAGSTPSGTLFAGGAPPAPNDLELSPQAPPDAAPLAATGGPNELALAAVPGHEAPPPPRPIGDLGEGARDQVAATPNNWRPDPSGARPLTPDSPGTTVQNFLQNMVGGGDFEDPDWSDVWSEVWLGAGRPVRTTRPELVIAGRASVWLGGSDSNDLIAYPVSFPETIAADLPSTLRFKVRQLDRDAGFDFFCVALADASGYPFKSSAGELISCADELPGGVQQVTINLGPAERAALAGQTGYLYLATVGDGLLPHMSAFVDDIALNIDFPPVSLEALPRSGPPGTTFLLASINNVPYGPVQICVSSCATPANALGTVFADARGEALAYLTTRTSAAPGSYTLESRNVAGRTGRTSFTLLGASPPAVRVAPAAAPPGSSFAFSGTGFLPNESEISVQVNGTTLGTVSSNAAGAVRFTITTRNTTPAGAYTARVTDSAGRTAEARYEVTAPAGATPRMSVTPAEGPPGTAFTFTGSGFAPSSAVRFTLEGSPTGETTTDAAGGFQVRLTTNPTIAPGTYTLEAAQGANRARASFQITGGGGSPPAGSGLSVTLAWTDPPGQPGAARALVNNLNLRVEGPGDRIWFGNGGNSADNVNNVETVRIAQPAPGNYRIIVQAAAVNATFGAQPFALLATAGQNSSTNLGTAPLGDGTQVYLPLLRKR